MSFTRTTEIVLNDWKNCCWVGINLFIGAFRIFGTLVSYLAFRLDSDYGYGEWRRQTNSEVSPSPRLADWRPGHLAPATFHSGEIVMKPLTLGQHFLLTSRRCRCLHTNCLSFLSPPHSTALELQTKAREDFTITEKSGWKCLLSAFTF